MRLLTKEMELRSIIKAELDEAEIFYITEEEKFGELDTDIVGYLILNGNPIKFTRSPTYWCVHGLIPLKLSQKIYQIQSKEIRTDGHITGIDPDLLPISYYNNKGQQLIPQQELDEVYNKNPELYKLIIQSKELHFVDDPTRHGAPYINTYHIDSQSGLNLFAKILKDEINS